MGHELFRYAQVDERGLVVSDSCLSGKVNADNMIPLEDNFDLTGKKWDFELKDWVEYVPEPTPEPEYEPTQLDNIEAQVTYIAMMM